jgi:anti-anti-sigma factor
VDLDGLDVIDDTALGTLLGAAGRARVAGGDLEVVTSSARLRERLAVTGFDRAVTVRSSLV